MLRTGDLLGHVTLYVLAKGDRHMEFPFLREERRCQMLGTRSAFQLLAPERLRLIVNEPPCGNGENRFE